MSAARQILTPRSAPACLLPPNADIGRSSLRANPRREVGAWLRAQRQGLTLQRLELGLQLGDALTLPHMLR
jgi:hypothetical protein